MFHNGVQFIGDAFGVSTIVAINRTGAALLEGGIYALDLTSVQAESVDARTKLSNVTAVAAANIDGILVVSRGTAADNEQGDFVVWGPCKALVDGGTVDVAAGDKLIATAASTALTKSGATTDNVQALSLESYTSGTPALKDVFFNGFGMAKPGTAS